MGDDDAVMTTMTTMMTKAGTLSVLTMMATTMIAADTLLVPTDGHSWCAGWVASGH